MFRQLCSTVLLVALASVVAAIAPPPVAAANGNPVVAEISPTRLAIAVSTARQASQTNFIPRRIVVSGRLDVHSWFLRADEIVFQPNAELVFARDALRERNDLFVVARRIVTIDPSRPGRITYERGPADPRGRKDAVSATPSLTLFVGSVPTGGPAIDFAANAMYSPPGGRRLPHGTRACAPGDVGGTVTLISYPETKPTLSRLFHVAGAAPSRPVPKDRNRDGYALGCGTGGPTGAGVGGRTAVEVQVGALTRNAFARELRIDERSYLGWLLDFLSD